MSAKLFSATNHYTKDKTSYLYFVNDSVAAIDAKYYKTFAWIHNAISYLVLLFSNYWGNHRDFFLSFHSYQASYSFSRVSCVKGALHSRNQTMVDCMNSSYLPCQIWGWIYYPQKWVEDCISFLNATRILWTWNTVFPEYLVRFNSRATGLEQYSLRGLFVIILLILSFRTGQRV